MKIKLLIIPLVIALVVIACVGFIYPTYSNGTDGIRDHYLQLKIEQDKLAAIRGKSGNVSKLLMQIDSLGSNKDVVTNFIPEKMDESMIVKNVSQMAIDSNLAVMGLNIKNPTTNNAIVPVDETTIAPLPTSKNFETDIQVSGDYAGIKNFLSKLGSFSRYNSVTYTSVKKYVAPGEAEAKTPSTSLTADIKADFYFLDKVKLSDNNVSDSVFSAGNLNTDVVSLIKDKRNFYPYNLSVDQTGKANPFIP